MAATREELLERGANTRFTSGKQAAEMGRLGGQASQKVQAEKKSMKAEIEEALAAIIKGSDGVDMTTQRGIIIKAVEQALDGDDKARIFLRDTVGQKPVDKVENEIKTPETALVRFV